MNSTEKHNPFDTSSYSMDGVDVNKLGNIIRHYWYWIVVILIVANLIPYFTLRYTKDVFQSQSEMKLDIKQDATELGLGEFLPDRQKINSISGEIETMQSNIFLSHIIDSLNLHVSYFTIGQILQNELYTASPFQVEYEITNPYFYNQLFRIYTAGANQYKIQWNKSSTATGTFNEPLELAGITLTIKMDQGDELDTENTYAFTINSKEALLKYISKNLTIEPINFDANTIRVSFKDNNPVKARDIVNAIDSLYLYYGIQQKNRANKQKIEWLTNELKNIEVQMETFENYFESFTITNRTSNLEGDLKITIEQINKIDSQRFELNKRITAVNEILDALTKPQSFITVTQKPSYPEYLNKNIEKLQSLYVEMDKMKLSYNENTFAFRQKQNQIESLRDKLQSQLTEVKTIWLKKLDELNKAKSKLESDFASMPGKSTQFNKNLRYYKLYEEFYLTMMQTKSQFEIALAGSTPDFKVLSTANLPVTPISPNKPMIYAIGFVAGLIINIFLIGIIYLVSNKIYGLPEIERIIHVPIIGVVPALGKNLSENDPLYISRHSKSPIAESIRTLRTNLDFFNVDKRLKVIAVSSTVSGEGKSFIAMNLGGIMALSNKRVLLLDLDMRKPKNISSISGETDRSKGMSTILIRKNSWQECIVKSPVENFDLLPAGPHPPNPSELLITDDFKNLIAELKNHYDYIIMDTPPVGIVTDGIVAMKHADLAIYLFRANYSKREFVANLHRIIRINKFNHITAILNALPSTSRTYGYGYYGEDETKRSWIKSIFKRSA